MSPTLGIGVRIATREDATLLLPMFEVFYGDHLAVHGVPALEERLEAAASVDTVLLALLDGQPAGFASVRLLPEIETECLHAELSDLYVDEAHRRHGVGRALMQSAEQLARDRRGSRMVVTAGLDNEGARAFYRALGYVEFGVTLDHALEGPR